MSVKSQFLDKLQTRQSAPASSVSKSQANIAELCLRMTQLKEQMDAWLEGTGLSVELYSTSVTDLLVENGTFEIIALVLRITAFRVLPMTVNLSRLTTGAMNDNTGHEKTSKAGIIPQFN